MYIRVVGSIIDEENKSKEVGLSSNHRAVVFRGNSISRLGDIVGFTLKEDRLKNYNIFTDNKEQAKKYGFKLINDSEIRQEIETRKSEISKNEEIIVILNTLNSSVINEVLNSKRDLKVYLIVIDKTNKCDLHLRVTEFIADEDYIWTQYKDVDFILFQNKKEYKEALHSSL